MKNGSTVYRHQFNTAPEYSGEGVRPVHEDWGLSGDPNLNQWRTEKRPHYSDEIPPFDVTISFANEYGTMSSLTIYGVEITNEGMGMSIDDITTEKACTFVARGLSDIGVEEFDNRQRGGGSNGATRNR